jgi:TolB-like protein
MQPKVFVTDDVRARKLATIVALDVAGYSASTEADEAKTTAEVAALRKVIEGIAARHGGRVFNTAGDGFMLDFGSSLAAVEAAFELAETCEPKVRVGVHLGDVVVQPNGDLLGHGVNVAQRLMAQASPGAALVSAAVRQTIRGPIADRLQSRGILKLDKMAETIEAFALTVAALATWATPPKDADPILTVLPFDNLSTDPEMQFFSDGVSEEIIQRLSRGAKLKVIGRTSSFQFRGEKKSEAARALKCSHLLDGSVRRAGARVRIAAHLVEATSHTTLWSEHYDRGLDDTFAVQDEIAEAIAGALQATFTSFSTKAIDPVAYDLYLRGSIKSYAPDELRANVGLLEAATQRAPNFAEAWGRLAYVRTWVRLYQPFAERAASAALVTREAERALALDPQNVDALTAQYFILPPYGSFIALDAAMERIRRAPGRGDGHAYVGWHARTIGRARECAEITEEAYPSDPLNPMFVMTTSMARMAIGQVGEAIPLLQDLMARSPGMIYPVVVLLRAFALLNDWPAVDRLLAAAANLPARAFDDGVMFIRAERNPTAENIGAMRDALEAHAARTGSVDVTRLVYAAHLGLVDDVYRIVESAHLGPRGSVDDVIGPDAYRTGMLFWKGMPEIRNDPRFVRLCARLGLVEFWLATQKWPDCVDEVPYDFKAACEKARSIPKEAFEF